MLAERTALLSTKNKISRKVLKKFPLKGVSFTFGFVALSLISLSKHFLRMRAQKKKKKKERIPTARKHAV